MKRLFALFLLNIILLNSGLIHANGFLSNNNTSESEFNSKSQLELLQSKIEEKRKLLEQILGKKPVDNTQVKESISSVNTNFLASSSSNSQINHIKESKNKENNHTEIYDSKEKKIENEKESKETKSLLKSIADMQYFNYQLLSKLKLGVDGLYQEMMNIKSDLSSKIDEIKLDTINLKQTSNIKNTDKNEEKKANNANTTTTVIKLQKNEVLEP